MNDTQKFVEHLKTHGLFMPFPIQVGKIQRFYVEGDRNGQLSGWYILFSYMGLLVGAYGNWRTSLSETWCSKCEQTFSNAERKN